LSFSAALPKNLEKKLWQSDYFEKRNLVLRFVYQLFYECFEPWIY
jgi:hypothetical protein